MLLADYLPPPHSVESAAISRSLYLAARFFGQSQDLIGHFGQGKANSLVIGVGRIEQAQLDSAGILAVNREVYASPVPGCTEWIGPAWTEPSDVKGVPVRCS